MTSLVAQVVKHLPTMWETQIWSLGQKDPLEKEMATHSSILAWRIPWTEEPGGLWSMGLQRVGHDWATKLSTFISLKGFSCGSAGKESARNAGHLGLIPWLGRSPGEGNSYLLQYPGLESQRVGHNWVTLSLSLFCSSVVLMAMCIFYNEKYVT